MTPQEYCARLEQALCGMAPEERQEILRYYREFLEDASVEERAALGTPEELARKICPAPAVPGVPPTPPPKKSHAGKLVLLICLFPIWLSLLLVWFVLLLCALIVLACIPISLGAAGIALGASAVFLRDLPLGLLLVGGGLCCAGLTILTAVPIGIACRGVAKFSVFSTKKLFSVL